MSDYLIKLGIKETEETLAHILHPDSDFNPKSKYIDFDFSTYSHFIELYSIRREKYIDSKIFQEYHDYFLPRYRQLDKLMRFMVDIDLDDEVIDRRQKLIQYFHNSKDKKNMLNLLDKYGSLESTISSAYDEKYSKLFPKLIHPFAETVSNLTNLCEVYKDDLLMKDYGERIELLFEQNPLTKDIDIFDYKRGKILIDSSETKLVNMSLKDCSGFDFGLSHNSLNLNLVSKEAEEIVNFIEDARPLIYTLGVFYAMGEAFKLAEKNGTPVSLPEINTEGIFEIENAMPIATKLNGKPVNINFSYERDNNQFILSGPHSGGKTELLRNVGIYHILGLSGFVIPANKGKIPRIDKIRTSFKKYGQKNKGSLESEMNETSEIANLTNPNDLLLLDEFLDTTKPELAAYLEEPLLKKLASTKAATLIVSHRATNLKQDLGFRFMYPELRELEVPYTDRFLHIATKGYRLEEEDLKKSEKNVKILLPTHRFIEGKPDPELTKRHAFQMWEFVKNNRRWTRFF